MAEEITLWLVERTYSDDEQNLIILTYATTDGEHYHRKERAITSFTGTTVEVTAGTDVDKENTTETPEDKIEQYRNEATRMKEKYDKDESI